MNQQIEIREAVTSQEVERFWNELHRYHARDFFSDPTDREDLEYFTGEEYQTMIQAMHDRPENRLFYLFFVQEGEEIGFAMPTLFDGKDGRCFIMEFCVYPAFRGQGAGTACANALLDWGRARGALYWELNCEGERRARFWSRLGFLPNGMDDCAVPLMILPPKEKLPVTVKPLTDPKNWELFKLENGYLTEIGEEPMDEAAQARLRQAITEEKIVFLLAMRGPRAVGMCSVAPSFSTFSCGPVAALEDFYVEPVFRKQGIARMLVQAAQEWCKEHGIPSLTVCCASCDEGMYHALGFDTPLGRSYAKLI